MTRPGYNKEMELSNAEYLYSDNYPLLSVEIDGAPFLIHAEQKPTLIRHGIVAVPGLEATANIPGKTIPHATDNPYLFRLAIAFILDCYHGRLEEGPANDDLDLAEVEELGQRLAPFAREGSPSWATVVAGFWPIRALLS
jgi:hypothetical protein